MTVGSGRVEGPSTSMQSKLVFYRMLRGCGGINDEWPNRQDVFANLYQFRRSLQRIQVMRRLRSQTIQYPAGTNVKNWALLWTAIVRGEYQQEYRFHVIHPVLPGFI